jgi:hypothetical protein
MPSQTYWAWFEAIRSKQRVRYIHKGHPREGCAHVLGLDKDAREKVLVCRVLPGRTAGEEWRCLFVSDTASIVPISGGWLNGPESHKQRNSCVVAVHIDVNQAAEQLFEWAGAKAPKNPGLKKKKPRTR